MEREGLDKAYSPFPTRRHSRTEIGSLFCRGWSNSTVNLNSENSALSARTSLGQAKSGLVMEDVQCVDSLVRRYSAWS
jgi:hypothetical protein